MVHKKRLDFLSTFSLLMCFLVLSQVPFRIFEVSYLIWWVVISLILPVGVGVSVARFRTTRIGLALDVRRWRTSGLSMLGAIVICLVFSIYHFFVGPYTEIPSDFWARLGDVSEQIASIKSGYFPEDQSITTVVQNRNYVPIIYASLSILVGKGPLFLVWGITWANSLVFLLGGYWFTLKLISRRRIQKEEKILIALCSSVLLMVAYGVGCFSFIRYYAYFPHILNMVLMWGSAALFLGLIKKQTVPKADIGLLLATLCTMYLINEQEFFFTLVILGTMFFGKWFTANAGSLKEFVNSAKSRQVKVLAVTVILFGLLSSLLIWFQDDGDWGWPHVIDIGHYFGIHLGLPIANPVLRPWETIGFYGVVIYLWYFFRIREFKGLLYVNATMASPLLTIFNPVFVLLFLTVSSWDPLWRFAYIVPLPIVGGYLAARVIFRFINHGFKTLFSKTRFLDVVFLAFLCVAVLPWDFVGHVNTTSPVASLKPVHQENGAELWLDAIRYLDSFPAENTVVTDYVSNYVFSTALQSKGLPHAKERWQKKTNFFSGDYQDKLLYYGMDGKILVVNKRDGRASETGKIAKHWPEDVLFVSSLYPPDILSFLESRPSDFGLLWKSDHISVYRILRDPDDY